MADTTISSPGFLVFLMVILGNGIRYGLRLFGEAVVGSLIVIYSYTLITRREIGRAKLAHERYIYSLTGLLNRRALIERPSPLFQSQGNKQRVVILFADLGGFKAVNDTHGHHVGDRVLASVASRISRALSNASARVCITVK